VVLDKGPYLQNVPMMGLTLCLWLAMILGCTSSRKASDLGPVHNDDNHLVDYNHGAKLLVQYIPAKDETSVYHYIPRDDTKFKDPPFKPDLSVNGQTISGKHTIELFDMVSFSGRKPTSIPVNTALTIIHGIVTGKDWHFLQHTRLIVEVDGGNFEIPVYSQMELKKDDPSDSEFYETLIAKPTYEMYSKIANSRRVTIKIGNGSFDLTPEYIASYRTLVGYLTPSK
jgi:hypothetical protein